MTRIVIPKPAAGTASVYEKFGLREAGSISVVSVAAKVRIEHSRCVDACVVIGAVAPTPMISEGATLPILGAIANAVADAIGARIFELPITPQWVLEAIQGIKNNQK